MKNRFSCMTANFVAQPLGYHMTEGWAQGDGATNDAFAPLETFADCFEGLLVQIKDLGFSAIDLWSRHLAWEWATPEHMAIAKELLKKHGVTVRSYSAWVMGGESDLRAACRFCRSFDIPYIVGHIELVDTDRDLAVSILREFAVAYAIENHTETSIEALESRLGEGDRDVIGIGLDTGWCATRNWDALEGLRRLYDRIFVVHAKDVLAKASEETGYQFVDWGHETCRLGDGIVPVEAVLKELRRRGFRGSICIEHEPERYDPSEEIKESLALAEAWWQEAKPVVKDPLKVVVVGCGNIANSYGEAMEQRPEIEVLGACDLDRERAKEWTGRFGGKAYPDFDAVLADEDVEAIVNLTIQAAHVEVVSKALKAGKHVHSEKPLAPSYAEAKALVDLAESEGLRLSCAPVTWLGECQRTARRLVLSGGLGTPRIAYVNVDWARIEHWHPNPKPFYEVGPLADVGVYSLTLLTAWFGPVRQVVADGTVLVPQRTAADGEGFEVTREDWMTLSLLFESGFRARITASFYVGAVGGLTPDLEIHGDEGSLRTQWFAATAPIEVGKVGDPKGYTALAHDQRCLGEGEWYCDWSAGVYELWKALRSDRAHPTSGAQAAHVVEIVEAAHESMRAGRSVAVASSFPAPQLS
ncbi:Gfo/Idh/MocA family oxidoreductase [Pelagicoccus sp. NFK12]|uniref:Gfo/Idh/MocA family oxidoreductase n=1 Tax=Pelagicoccus enzymogenes TaxID=2773457 RepID=A0A927F990_9BACT|nr:Gfo/Idh/MocA family oxidoreductase [Pelagicoccus enzymogenes]MBD5779510.1 Gfo/Idh/MocA family oxidoreductase [Pelagicoccus enzymogenes]